MRTLSLHLLLALVLIVAPSALTLCQVECGAHAARAHGAQQHSCHDAAAPGTRVSAPSHVCGHANNLDESIAAATGAVAPLAILPLTIAHALPPINRIFQSDPPSPFAPPNDAGAGAQLRI